MRMPAMLEVSHHTSLPIHTTLSRRSEGVSRPIPLVTHQTNRGVGDGGDDANAAVSLKAY